MRGFVGVLKLIEIKILFIYQHLNCNQPESQRLF